MKNNRQNIGQTFKKVLTLIYFCCFLIACSNLIPDFFWIQEILLALMPYNAALMLLVMPALISSKIFAGIIRRFLFILFTLLIVTANLWPYKIYFEGNQQKQKYANSVSFYYVNLSDKGSDNGELANQIIQLSPDLLLFLELTPYWESVISKSGFTDPYKFVQEAKDPSGYKMRIYSKISFGNEILRTVGGNLPEFILLQLDPKIIDSKLLLWHAEQPLMPEGYLNNKVLARRLATIVRHSQNPFLVFGDFNALPGSKSYSWFNSERNYPAAKGYGYQKTWNADVAFLSLFIDHIFIDKTFEVIEYKKLPSIGSDHYPQYVSIGIMPVK